MALSLTPEMLLWLSGGFVSFARGLNDTPKIVAVVAAAALIGKDDPSIMRMAFPLAAVAMGIGSLWGGRRVTKRLAEDVTALDSLAGLTASLATAVLVTLATQGGLPVSTTHVSSGAIVGVGLRNGTERVQWQTVRHFLMAWVVTLPAAGVIAACSLLGLPLVGLEGKLRRSGLLSSQQSYGREGHRSPVPLGQEEEGPVSTPPQELPAPAVQP